MVMSYYSRWLTNHIDTEAYKTRGIENVSMDSLLAEFSDHARGGFG
jgi:hypothetical protein